MANIKDWVLRDRGHVFFDTEKNQWLETDPRPRNTPAALEDPREYTEHYDTKLGLFYYCNSKTKMTTWVPPVGFRVTGNEEWRAFRDGPSNRIMFVNEQTNEISAPDPRYRIPDSYALPWTKNGAGAPRNEGEYNQSAPVSTVAQHVYPNAVYSNAASPAAAIPRATAPPAAVSRATAPPAAVSRATAPPAAVSRATAPPAAVSRATAPPAAVSRATAPPAAVPKATAPPAAVPKATAPPAAVPRATAPPAAVPKATAPPAAVPRATAPPAAASSTGDQEASVLQTAFPQVRAPNAATPTLSASAPGAPTAVVAQSVAPTAGFRPPIYGNESEIEEELSILGVESIPFDVPFAPVSFYTPPVENGNAQPISMANNLLIGDESQVKNVFLVGLSGAGKSTLASFLISGESATKQDNTFHVGHGAESDTKDMDLRAMDFRGREVNVIDSPGLGDSDGTDSEVFHAFKTFLDENQFACAIIMVIDASNPRISPMHQKMFKIAVEVFGPKLTDVLAVVLTKWSNDPKEVKKRQVKGQTNDFLVESQSQMLSSLGIFSPPRSRWFFIDAEYDSTDAGEVFAASTAREQLLSWAIANENMKTEYCVQFDTERQQLLGPLSTPGGANLKLLGELSSKVLEQVIRVTRCSQYKKQSMGRKGPRFTGRPEESVVVGRSKISRAFSPKRVHLAFEPVGYNSETENAMRELASLARLDLGSLAKLLLKFQAGAVDYNVVRLQRKSIRNGPDVSDPLVRVKLASQDTFIKASRVELHIDSGVISLDTNPMGAGASRVVFRAKVIRGTPLNFENGSDLVIKAMKRDIYEEGMRMPTNERETQLLCRTYSEEFNKTFPLFKQNEPLRLYFRVGSPAKCPIEIKLPNGVVAITAGEDVFVEMFVHGKYEKFNSNSGWTSENGTVPDFFSHWTWVYSQGKHLVCDLQGYKGEPGGPKLHGASVYYLFTDPVVMSSAQEFGDTDLGEGGILDWFENHKCNQFCLEHKLPRPNKKGSQTTSSSSHRVYKPLAYKRPY